MDPEHAAGRGPMALRGERLRAASGIGSRLGLYPPIAAPVLIVGCPLTRHKTFSLFLKFITSWRAGA